MRDEMVTIEVSKPTAVWLLKEAARRGCNIAGVIETMDLGQAGADTRFGERSVPERRERR